ncbi:hypothetical protein SLT67_00285 [Paenibacillus illinoisensis]
MKTHPVVQVRTGWIEIAVDRAAGGKAIITKPDQSISLDWVMGRR